MLVPPSSTDEAKRLTALRALRIPDTSGEERFDCITRTAMRFFDVPIATISLVDDKRERFMSRQGLSIDEMPIADSFAAHTIMADDLLVVSDTGTDPRFSDNPMVVDQPNVKFYAGCPIMGADGSRLGALGIMDRRRRQLSADALNSLRDMASWAQTELLVVPTLQHEELRSRTLMLAIVNNTTDVVLTLDLKGVITSANPAASKLLGYKNRELLGRNILSILPNLYSGEEESSTELKAQRKDGMHLPLEVHMGKLRLGGEQSIVLIGRDISERKTVEGTARQSDELFQKAFDDAPIGMALVEAKYKFIKANKALANMLGYTPRELGVRSSLTLTHPQDVQKEIGLAAQLLNGVIPSYTMEKRYIAKGQDIVHARVTALAVRDASGQAVHMLNMVEDLTERKRTEAALRDLSVRDELTHLYNEREMLHMLQEEADRYWRYDRPVSLVVLDIDNFRSLNETHGILVGDAVLRWLAQLLNDAMRSLDRLARLEGDKMVVILPETPPTSGARIIDRLRKAIADQPFTYILPKGEHLEIGVTVSLGVAGLPGDADSVEELMAAAYGALDEAKQRGRNRTVRFRKSKYPTGNLRRP